MSFMKKIIAALLCAALLICLSACGEGSQQPSIAPVSSAAASSRVQSVAEPSEPAVDRRTPVRIMPIGDAMTEGDYYDVCGAYRAPLIKMLESDGVPYEFVGLYNTASENIPSGQQMHSSWDGASIFAVEKELPKMISLNPDIILLMFGRGEANDGINGEAFIEYFDKYIISKILKYFPYTEVYVASIPPIRELGGPKKMDKRDIAQRVTNPLIRELVEAKKAEGKKIEYVDMSLESTGLTWEDFSVDDNIKPLQSGNDKLAAVWHNAIKDKVAAISAEINR